MIARSGYDETAFWSRQFAEHLLFLSMLFTDPKAKRDAETLHSEYERARQQALAAGAAAPQTIAAAHQRVRGYQGEMFERLEAGEFLGWAFPLFVAHITREMDLYSHLVYGTPPPDVGVDGEVKRLGAEHAEFAAHLLDPTQVGLVKIANQAAKSLHALVDKPGAMANAAAVAAEIAIAKFLEVNKIGSPGGALSIIPKVLTDHVIREQHYFADTLRSD